MVTPRVRWCTGDPRLRPVLPGRRGKDARFDGWFFTAVKTTGIYCRPSCPARTPYPKNVEFFPTAAAAQRAGYRACKRCRPDASPGSPEWDPRGDVVARAMRLIGDGVVDREGVSGLAAPARVQRAAAPPAARRPSSAPVRSRSPARNARRPRGCSSRRRTSASPTSRSPPGSRASASSTTRSARCSRRRRARCAHAADRAPSRAASRCASRRARRSPATTSSRSSAPRAVAGIEAVDAGTYQRSLALPHGHARAHAHARPGRGDGHVPARRPARPHRRGGPDPAALRPRRRPGRGRRGAARAIRCSGRSCGAARVCGCRDIPTASS